MISDHAVDVAASLVGRLGSCDLRLVGVAAGFQVGNAACRAGAWANVLRAAVPQAPPRRRRVACAYLLGAGANAVVPTHVGDVLKAAVVRKDTPEATLPGIFASLALISMTEFALGILALVAVALTIGLPPVPVPSWLLTALLVALPVVVVAALAAHRRLGGRLASLRRSVAQGLAVVRTPGRFLREVVSLLALGWILRVASVLVLLHAFGIRASLATTLLVIVASGLSGALSLTPGGAGTQQLTLVYVLHGTASAAAALSYSLGSQAEVAMLNCTLAFGVLMILARTMRPAAAWRSGRALLAQVRAG